MSDSHFEQEQTPIDKLFAWIQRHGASLLVPLCVTLGVCLALGWLFFPKDSVVKSRRILEEEMFLLREGARSEIAYVESLLQKNPSLRPLYEAELGQLLAFQGDLGQGSEWMERVQSRAHIDRFPQAITFMQIQQKIDQGNLAQAYEDSCALLERLRVRMETQKFRATRAQSESRFWALVYLQTMLLEQMLGKQDITTRVRQVLEGQHTSEAPSREVFEEVMGQYALQSQSFSDFIQDSVSQFSKEV